MTDLTPEQIWENFKNAEGTASQQEGCANLASLAVQLPRRAHAVVRIMDEVERTWTGAESREAMATLGPVAAGLLDTADATRTTQALIAAGIDAFHTAASKVVPMPPKPPLNDPPDSPENVAYNKAAQTNLDAMREYEATVDRLLSSLPPVDTAPPSGPSPFPRQ